MVWSAKHLIPEENSGKISFGVVALSPYAYRMEDGSRHGLLFETSELIIKDAGLSGDLHLLPIKRLLRNISNESIDCSLVAGTPKVKKTFRLIEAIGQEFMAGVFPRAGVSIKTYADLAGLIIAVPRGVMFDPLFDQDKSLKKFYAKGYDEAIKLLSLGRVDAVAGSLTTYEISAKADDIPNGDIFGRPLVFYKTPLWLGCSHNRPSAEKIDRLRSTVIKLRKNGTFNRVFR